MKTALYIGTDNYPVSLVEVKDHLRITGSGQDSYLNGLIVAATMQAEQHTRRRFMGQTWKAFLDYWPCGDAIRLPFGQLRDVLSITYQDSDGVINTLSPDAYVVDTDSEPGRVVLAYGESWPAFTAYPRNPICITFESGFYAPTTSWAAETEFTTADYIAPGDADLVYKCDKAGESGATEPTWGLTLGANTVDGTDGLEWLCIGRTVPEMIKAAIKIMVADLYENRESAVFSGAQVYENRAVKNLLLSYIIWEQCP